MIGIIIKKEEIWWVLECFNIRIKIILIMILVYLIGNMWL